MKRWNDVLKILADAVLIVCGILAAVCAVPTSFSIPFIRSTMLIGCVLAGLLLSAWMHLPRGGIGPGLTFLIGTVVYGAVQRNTILFGTRWILYALTEPLSRDFSFIPALAAPALPEGADITYIAPAVTSALLMLAAVIGLLLSFSLIRGRTALLSALMPLPTFLLSLVYTDQPPVVWVVVLLAVYCGGALLGQGVRRGNSDRLGWYFILTVPLLVMFALLIRVASPETVFTPIPFEQRKEMLGDRVDELSDFALSVVRRNPKRYDLNRQDDRVESDDKAFSMKSSQTGTFLLRTRSYGHYRNGVWQEADDYKGEWRSMEALSAHASGSGAKLSIRDSVTGERYVPYAFSTDEELKINESNIAASGRTEYRWNTAETLDLTPYTVTDAERDYLDFAQKAYTMPDSAQKERFLHIAQDAGLARQSDNYQTAVRVAAYVRNSGSYTLTPEKVPKGFDFTEYFLTEGHEGFCVHFASATTALLQAMDVPARYTLGYRAVISSSNTWTDVTEATAHAWVEVYEPGVGWIPIESTAGFSHDPIGRQTLNQESTPYPTETPDPTVAPTPDITPEPSASVQPSADETQNTETGAVQTPNPFGNQTSKPLIIGGTDEDAQTRKKISAWWLLLLLVPLLPAAWIGICALVRTRRQNRFRQKNAKTAVLLMLQYLARLERFGVKRDPRAESWAEEAAFSDHDMTDTRKLLLSMVGKTQDGLYRDAPVKRFFVKWILLAI